MSIQNKLFGAFALTILMAALSIALSLASLLTVQGLSAELMEIYQGAQRIYQAQSYLQKMERAEKTFVLDQNTEKANDFLIYLALFDDHYRQTLLEADTAEVKNALHKIDRARTVYLQTFDQITQAVLIDKIEVPSNDPMVDTSTNEMGKIYEQLDTLLEIEQGTFSSTLYEQDRLMDIAMTVNIITLIVFLALATFTMLVILRGVFAPAGLLTKTARAISEDRFDPEMLAPVTGVSDEMGDLADAFIVMAAAIITQEADLRVQIDEARERLESYE